MGEEYFQEHIFDYSVAPVGGARRLIHGGLQPYSHFAQRSRVMPDTSLLAGLFLSSVLRVAGARMQCNTPNHIAAC
jgi:hypothetical protein